jgi:hypothetical protein
MFSLVGNVAERILNDHVLSSAIPRCYIVTTRRNHINILNPTQANIVFHRLIQNTHYLLKEGSPDNSLIFVIEFTVKVGERLYSDLSVQISQPCGTNFEESFEVRKIEGLNGPNLNRDQFVQLCEEYYQSLVGPTGGIIRANAGSS